MQHQGLHEAAGFVRAIEGLAQIEETIKLLADRPTVVLEEGTELRQRRRDILPSARPGRALLGTLTPAFAVRTIPLDAEVSAEPFVLCGGETGDCNIAGVEG